MSAPKKSKVDDEDSLREPAAISAAVEGLQLIQGKLDKVNDDASDKVLEIEQQYNKIRRPIYLERNDHIKQIPEFWLTAFENHPVLKQVITDEDTQLLRYLKEVDVEDFPDIKSGYKIRFIFEENPFFFGDTLVKEFHFSPDAKLTITGTKPEWKPGQAELFEGSNQEDGAKRPREITTFFQWFGADDTLDYNQTDAIAEAIKDQLWVDPLKFYDGDVEDGEDGEGDYEENGEGFYDEGEEEDFEEGDEEEEEQEEDDDEVQIIGEEGEEYEEGDPEGEEVDDEEEEEDDDDEADL